ncbi:MAG: UTRA domain-containing protein [Luteitalea sp.]|nr:UTRA domain-containing protein [Luteitalea sp.]
MTVNRNAPIPLYHQLKTLVLKEIDAGRWKPDDQLPTEQELMARFQVSKITVRQALQELAHDGYIRREQGRGTFVQRPPLEQGPRELTSFTDEMRRRGLPSTSEVLDQGAIEVPADVAATLGMSSSEPVFRLRRLRLADGEPMGVQTAYIPMASVPGIEEINFAPSVSLYALLSSRYSLYPARARETHVAVLISTWEAELLGVAPGSPGLVAERVTYLASGRPLEYVQSVMRGDRYKVVLELTTPRARR